jgi:hypothetical protein
MDYERANPFMAEEWPEPVLIGWDRRGYELLDSLWNSDSRRDVPETERSQYAYRETCMQFLQECIDILSELHPGCRFDWNSIPAFQTTHVHLEPWPSAHHTNALHRYAWREQQIQEEVWRVEALVRERGTFWIRADDPQVVAARAQEEQRQEERGIYILTSTGGHVPASRDRLQQLLGEERGPRSEVKLPDNMPF